MGLGYTSFGPSPVERDSLAEEPLAEVAWDGAQDTAAGDHPVIVSFVNMVNTFSSTYKIVLFFLFFLR